MSDIPLTDALWKNRRPDSPEILASELNTLCRRLERDRDELVKALLHIIVLAGWQTDDKAEESNQSP